MSVRPPNCASSRVERRDHRIQPRGEDRESRLQPQHQRGVDHVLAGRAEMHPRGVRLADRGAELPHELRHHHPVAGGGGRERCDVGAEAGERRGDGRGGVGRDHARARLRLGERGLEGEHRGELGLRADQRRDLGVADEAAEPGMIEGRDHQTSRNTVSPSPCSRMSKR